MVTIILDNGASTIKVGIVNKDEQPRLVYLKTLCHSLIFGIKKIKSGSFPMLSLGQREINQHTLAMNWHNAKIIRLFIIVYPSKRFGKFHTHIFSKYFVCLGLPRWLGCRKSCLGRYLFRPSSWGEIFQFHFKFFSPCTYIDTFFFFPLFGLHF